MAGFSHAHRAADPHGLRINVQAVQARARHAGGMVSLLILLTGQAMAVMDGSILVVASPSLRVDLHASAAELQLIVAMYTLAFGALVITGARLGKILGHRRAFIQGLVAFTLASLLAGLAPDPAVLIAARSLQGAAAALMTPQVLSIIQAQFDDDRRARAIGAYSMILAVGVAAGQILGGLLVTAHLLAAAWRPALLLNVPIGVLVLAASRRGLTHTPPGTRERLDLAGVGLLAIALVALVVPLTFGREYHWPVWGWLCLVGCGLVAAAFTVWERRLRAAGGRPLLDLQLLTHPGVAAGIAAVLLITASYAGFLLTLTLYLQGARHFSPLHSGLIFAIYASGFAIASLSWTRVGPAARARLPVVGPMTMGGALLAVGLIAGHGSWPTPVIAPLLLIAGAGHALGFSPLANRMTSAIRAAQAADLSGLVLAASFIGQVLGFASLTDIYLSNTDHGPAHALTIATTAIAVTLVITAACARHAPTERAGSPGGLAPGRQCSIERADQSQGS
jgi:MFS family permease